MIKDQIEYQLVYSKVRIFIVRNQHCLVVQFFMTQDFPDGTDINDIVTKNHVIDEYEYLKRCPIINNSTSAKNIGFSFNSSSKAIRVLQEHDIVVQIIDNERNFTWKYRAFNMDADNI